MEAGAVFLIIAGVLLGPFERMKLTVMGWGDWWECTKENFSRPKEAEKRDCSFKAYEPIAKTCERAMLEAGAFQALPSLPPGYRFEGERKALPGDEWRLIGGEKVLCIPAPSGLVR